MGRILAIDFGTKRTGIAVTDPGQMIAAPLATIATHELMHFFEHYFSQENVERLVVGEPRKLDHSESESMRPLRFFVAAFRKHFPAIPVSWMDERFSSSLAKDALVRGGMKKSRRQEKGNLDKVSAALILQSYLESRNRP